MIVQITQKIASWRYTVNTTYFLKGLKLHFLVVILTCVYELFIMLQNASYWMADWDLAARFLLQERKECYFPDNDYT